MHTDRLPRRFQTCSLLAVLVAGGVWMAPQAGAATLTWDPGNPLNGTTIDDGAGDWNTLLAWNNAGLNQTWVANSTAIFTGTVGGTVTGNASTSGITVNGSKNYTFSGNLSGTGGLTKGTTAADTGILVLTGANSYSGTTTVNAGVLQLLRTGGNNPLGSSSVVVNTGGTLLYHTNSGGPWNAPTNAVNLAGGTLSFFATGGAGQYLTAGPTVTVTAASTLTIQAGSAGSPNASSMFLDNGLQGSANLVVNNYSNGIGLVLRNGTTTYSGTMTVNGNATAAVGAGSGLSIGTNIGAPNLSGMHLVMNGTLELGNTGMGWASGAVSGTTVQIGALGGTGVVVGNMTTGGSTRTLSIGNDNGSDAFSGQIVNGNNNTLSLIKNGTGTQTLSGANTYTGATTVNAGTLRATGTFTSNFEVKSGATLSGTGTTTGSLTLQAGSAIVGGTSTGVGVAGNCFTANGVTALGAAVGSTGTIASGQVLDVVGYGSGTSPGTANFSAPGNSQFRAGVFADDLVAKKITVTYNAYNNAWNTGSGLWDTLTSANWINNNGAGDNLYASGDGVYFTDNNVNSGAPQTGTTTGVTGSPITVTLNSVVTPAAVNFTADSTAYTLTGTGALAGTTSVSKSGAGTVVLATNNTYTGGTTVLGGTLQMSGAGTLGNAGNQLTLDGGTLDLNGTSQGIGNFTGTAGTLTNASGTASTLTMGNNNATGGDFAGAITGNLALAKVGTGTLTLSGSTSNTHTGTTTVYSGALSLAKTGGATAMGGNLTFDNGASPDVYCAANNQFAAGAVVSFVNNIGDHGRFDLMGTTQTVAGIQTVGYTAIRGVVQNSEAIPNSGSSTLTLNGSGTYVFNGFLRNGSGAGIGTLGLTKNGAGTQVLAGNQITYTGATAVNTGTLELSGTTGYVSATTVGNGATLKVSNTALQGMNAAITLNTGATLTHNGTTINNNYWTNSQAVTVASGASVTLNESSVANTTNNYGVYLDGGLKGGGAGATVTINGGNSGNAYVLRNNNSTFAGTIIVNGVVENATTVGSGLAINGATTGLQNADMQVNGTLELGKGGLGWATTYASPFTLAIGALSGSGTVVMDGVASTDSQTLIVGNTGNSGSFSGVLADHYASVSAFGTLGLTKAGAGTQTLTGANTYTGRTTVSAGVLSVATLADGGTASGIGASSVNASNLVIGGGTLQYTGGTVASNRAFTLSAGTTGTIEVSAAATTLTLSGGTATTTGALTKAGAGTLILSGADTHTGATKVNAGTLQFAKQVSLYNNIPASWTAANITVESGATLALNVGGTGEFTSANVDTLKALGTATGGFKNGSTLGFDTSNAAGGNFTYGSVIANTNGGANALSIVKLGTNTLTFTNANTYTGATTVAAGTLEVTANGALGTGSSTTVNAGGTLKLANVNYATAEALSLNGTGVGGVGALQSSGTSIYAGLVTVASNATINNGGGTLTLTGGLVKDGTTVTFTGTGGKTVISGTGISGASSSSDLVVSGTTLVVNALSTYNGPTTVQNGGTLAGNTTITSTLVTVNADSFITAGVDELAGTEGILNLTGTVDFDGTYLVDLDLDAGISGTPADGSEADLIAVTGDVDLTNLRIQLRGTNAPLPAAGTPYAIKLLSWTGIATTTVADGANFTNFNGGLSLAPNQSIVRHGNALYLVPEPASFALLSLGSLLLLRRPSRRRGRTVA